MGPSEHSTIPSQHQLSPGQLRKLKEHKEFKSVFLANKTTVWFFHRRAIIRPNNTALFPKDNTFWAVHARSKVSIV